MSRRENGSIAAGARALLVGFAALLATAVVGRDVGPYQWSTVKGVTFALLVGASLLTVVGQEVSRPRRVATLLLPAVALLALDAAWDVRVAAGLWCAVLCWLADGRRGPRALLAAAAVFPVLRLAWPALFAEHRAFADWLASVPIRVLAAVSQENARALVAGPTATGVPLVALALTAVVAASLRARRIAPLVLVPVVLGAWTAYPLAIPDVDPHAPARLYFSRLPALAVVLFALASVACFATRRLERAPATSDASSSRPRRRSVAWISLGAAVAFAALGLVVSGAAPFGPPATGVDVLVLNRGGLDWQRPRYGSFGDFSGGMFGLLPFALRHEGHRVSILDRDEVRAEDLEGHDVLLLINCPKRWTDEEAHVVESFVERGGGLIVLGDHTDVFGLMEGYDTLLPRFGIRFRFDSAYFARGTWSGGQDTGPEAIARPFARRMPGIAIGASLDVEPPARVLVEGRYGFSDVGLRENVMGSFLGDYAYADGERLGDLPLIAHAPRGEGAVVVFGDTTGFQNGSIASRLRHEVLPLLHWLAEGPSAGWTRPLVRAIAGGLAVLAVLLLLLFVAEAPGVLLLPLFMLCAVLAVAGSLAHQRFAPPLKTSREVALLDQSLLPRTGHYDAGGNVEGPLASALARSGLLVRWSETWDEEAIRRARVLSTVAPQVVLDDGKVRFLLDAMTEGLLVVAAAGADDAAGLRPLLHRLGLDVRAVPLGPVPRSAGAHARDEVPFFLGAFPIVLREPSGRFSAVPDGHADVEVAYRYGGDALVVFRRVGAGGLLLVADSRFFSTRNVEGHGAVSKGNVRFVYELLRRYAGLSDEVEVAFPDPPDTP